MANSKADGADLTKVAEPDTTKDHERDESSNVREHDAGSRDRRGEHRRGEQDEAEAQNDDDLNDDLDPDVATFLAAKRGEDALRTNDSHDLVTFHENRRQSTRERRQRERADKRSSERSSDGEDERVGQHVGEDVTHVSYPDGSEYHVEDGKVSRRKSGN